MWLIHRQRRSVPPFVPYLCATDLDRVPCLTVTALGIANARQSQWWLADEPPREAVVTTRTKQIDKADKPAYRIPLMSEIREIPHNGLNVVSLFCGAGGSSTGYRMAGYRVLAAVEFVPEAADSYQANCAEYTTVLRRDVRGLKAEEVLEAAGLEVGELDLLDGSPPCEPFSTAGRRERTWNSVREYSGQRQRTDDLFFEYARLVNEIRPKCFVAENVPGLTRGRAKGYFKWIMQALRDCGYRVAARTLDASWLGVPQSRHRVIMIGVRSDLEGGPAFPVPLAYRYTVRDAIGDLLANGTPRMGTFDSKWHPPEISDAPAPTVAARDNGFWHVDELPVEQIIAGPRADLRFTRQTGGAHQAIDQERDRIDEPCPTISNGTGGNSHHYKVEEYRGPISAQGANGFNQHAPADIGDRPMPTVQASRAVDIEYDQQTIGNEAYKPQFGPLDGPHPTICATIGYSDNHRTSGELRSSATMVRRRFTIAELRRICGFPDDFILVGSFSQQWERLGDAVPPPMAASWARALAEGPLAQADSA